MSAFAYATGDEVAFVRNGQSHDGQVVGRQVLAGIVTYPDAGSDAEPIRQPDIVCYLVAREEGHPMSVTQEQIEGLRS